mmetsp:Transcript_20812/g.34403  ORF Transcript_20812/g.34403 Transcript_20812/m.34403 type:complete len:234 (-) Transcript_20812:96-797(-)
MDIWRILTAAYSVSLDKRPLLTEMTTSGCIWTLGDLASQHLEKRKQRGAVMESNGSNPQPNNIKSSSIDWQRTFHQTLYASILWGPVAHKWYRLLDQVAHVIVPSGRPSLLIATKLMLEIACLHPASLLAYFSVVGKLNGESLSTIQHQLRTDFLPTLLLEVALWTPLDVLNFSLVPVKHQLLVANCGCFIESVGLSFIKNNGFDSILKACHISPSSSSSDKSKDKINKDKKS